MNTAPWWVALAIPAMSGAIAWGVAWYTNHRVDLRERHDREERERARTSDREADLSRALLPARIEAHREVAQAVSPLIRILEGYIHARDKGGTFGLAVDPNDLRLVHQENVHMLAALFDLEIAGLAKSVQDDLLVLQHIAHQGKDPSPEDLKRFDHVRKEYAEYLVRVGQVFAGTAKA